MNVKEFDELASRALRSIGDRLNSLEERMAALEAEPTPGGEGGVE